MLKTLFVILFTVVSTIFWGSLTIIASFFSRTGNLPHSVARLWGRGILFVSGIKVTVEGLTNIDASQSYIYMPNHLSNFDIPVMLSYLPAQFRWLAKTELFKITLFGLAMKRAGYISIDRSNRRSAFASLKRAAETIRKGTSVLIFPEGTRSLDGNMRTFKKGGFFLALNAGVPVVPVAIRGTWEIMSKNGWMIRPGRVVVQIARPIPTADYNRKTKGELMAKVRQAISEPQHMPESN